MQEHRSSLHTGKETPVSDHFLNLCHPLDMTVIPLEIVQKTPINLDDSLFKTLDILKENHLLRLEREQYWMERLETKAPNGINKRKDLPDPMPFIIKYSDSAGHVMQVVKQFYQHLKLELPSIFFKRKLVTAYRKNKSLKDILVSATVK